MSVSGRRNPFDTIEVAVTTLQAEFANLRDRVETYAVDNESQLRAIRLDLHNLEDKVSQILLAQAFESGKAKGMKITAVVISSSVSLLVSLVSVFFLVG